RVLKEIERGGFVPAGEGVADSSIGWEGFRAGSPGKFQRTPRPADRYPRLPSRGSRHCERGRQQEERQQAAEPGYRQSRRTDRRTVYTDIRPGQGCDSPGKAILEHTFTRSTRKKL